MTQLIIKFKGDKQGLHKQLKVWCAEADTNMNQTVQALIEKHLKEQYGEFCKK